MEHSIESGESVYAPSVVTRIVAGVQLVASVYGLGWCVVSAYVEGVSHLLLWLGVLCGVGFIGGVLLFKGKGGGVLVSLLFQLPQAVFWQTIATVWQFYCGPAVFLACGGNDSAHIWTAGWQIGLKLIWLTAWGQPDSGWVVGVNFIPLFVIVSYLFQSRGPHRRSPTPALEGG